MTQSNTPEQLLGKPRCTSCQRIQLAEIPMLQVQTTEELHTFCYICVKKSIGVLHRKKFKTIPEVDLLIHLRRFLRSIPKS